MNRSFGTIWAIAFVAIALPAAGQQKPAASETREANIKTYVELLRKDIKTSKVAILSELMNLSPEEAAKFWPVYNEFDRALTTLGDEKVSLIRQYAQNYSAMTPPVATKLALGALDLEDRRTQLKRQYFLRLSQVLNPIIAARYLQIENQLEKIFDLQVASSLPIVE